MVWNRDARRWIMALYLERKHFALFSSRDLESWEQVQTIEVEGATECPDLFELPVDGKSSDKKWVFWTANGSYLIGTFDGAHFTRESGILRADYGRNYYAAQTWSDIPQ